MTTITLTEEDGWWVTTDEEPEVTTQGETKLEALLMSAASNTGMIDEIGY